MKKLATLFLLLSAIAYSQPTYLQWRAIQPAPANLYIPVSATSGTNTGVWTPTLLTSVIPSTVGLLPNTTSLTINGTIKTFTSTPSFTVGNLNGSLTTGYFPYAVSSSSVANSPLFTDGTKIGIGTASPNDYLSFGIRSASGSTSPYAINMGGSYSTVAGQNLKFKLYDDGGSVIGIGLSPGRFDYQTTTNNIGHCFYLGSSPVMVIGGNATDNVGIGTVSPAEKLEVSGYAKATGFKIPSGTSSQFLLADGSYTTISTGSTTAITGTNNISVTGSAPNYTVGVQSSPTFTTSTLTGVTTQSTTNFTGQIKQFKGADAASSSTVDLGSLTGNYIHITGTITINSFGTAQAGTEITTVFDNTLTVTSSTNIVMPDNYNIVTAAGDIAIWRSEGSGVWNLVNYQIKSNSWFPWTTTFTGFSANPAGYTFRYTLVGKMCTCYYVGAAGTSNATSFTMTLPFVAANTVAQSFSVLITDAGTSTAGFIRTRVNSNVMDVYKGPSFNAFTNSGNKSVTFSSFTYEIQ